MAGENLVNRPKTLRAWCENFWYHYKYHTIATVVLVVSLVVILAQCATRTEYDYTIMLATSTVEMSSVQINALQEELTACGEDLNGDGSVNVVLVDCTFDELESGYQVIMAKKQKLQSMIMNEENALILIADPECYQWINSITETGFMENTGLPEGDGRYYNMTDSSFVTNAKAAVDSGFIWPEELVVSRRRVDGTIFEGRKGMDKAVSAADAFIQRIMTNGIAQP